MAPNATNDTNAYPPTCECATVQCVKCVTRLTSRSAVNDPCSDTAV